MHQKIGILALQGDFTKHESMLKSLNIETLLVKKPENLFNCNGLIIPGGESTTFTKLMQQYELYEKIYDFSKTYPIMGTCAGAIMVAAQVDDERVNPLQLIDISVTRNAYGRQTDSFIADVDISCFEDTKTFRTIFIRAPQIQRVGPQVKVLMELHGKPIMVRENNILALTFHPELTDDLRIHKYFIDKFVL
ncbi:Pyridoxal 5'-phosphate synthase subunit PdxT [Candidatus Magnetomoraceae bacterium gMMP-15]